MNDTKNHLNLVVVVSNDDVGVGEFAKLVKFGELKTKSKFFPMDCGQCCMMALVLRMLWTGWIQEGLPRGKDSSFDAKAAFGLEEIMEYDVECFLPNNRVQQGKRDKCEAMKMSL